MKDNKGFTLIELLVVIFIIGVLAGVILPNLMSARERARDSKRKQDLNEIKTALRLYYNDNQIYPGTLSFGEEFGDGGEYMKIVPVDPVNTDSYVYVYSQPDDEEGFLLEATLENSGDRDISESQSLCGYPTPTPGKYFVCTN